MIIVSYCLLTSTGSVGDDFIMSRERQSCID